MNKVRSIQSIESAAESFLREALAQGHASGHSTAAAYDHLVEVADPDKHDFPERPFFAELSLGHHYRDKHKIERALKVAHPLMYASGFDTDTIADLMANTGLELEGRMPYVLIDGPRRMRRETNRELTRIYKKYEVFGAIGRFEDDPRQRLSLISERMPIRSFGATIQRLAGIGINNINPAHIID